MLIKQIARGLLDAVYPPVCALCGELSDGKYPHCCPACLGSFELIGPSCCTLCGEPAPGWRVPMQCLRCIRGRQPFQWCRGIYVYRGALAEALARAKYGREPGVLEPLGDSFLRGLAELDPFPLPDLVLPVPLSPKGLWKRGFNQSYLLAVLAAEHLGLEVLEGVLSRRTGLAQVGLTARERRLNASASFVPGRSIGKVSGRRVLLVDDVYTTGATVRACARILNGAGAAVSVLTLARAGKSSI